MWRRGLVWPMKRGVVAAVFVLVLTMAAQAEQRVALVIGQDTYETVRALDNAVSDARAIRTSLENLGFDPVFFEPNRDLLRMRKALEKFRSDAAGADVALVFFTGHGVEIAGENRLLPVDADDSSLEALKASTLPLEEVRATVAAVGKVGLILLDACRDDPFGTDAARRRCGGDGQAGPGTCRAGGEHPVRLRGSTRPNCV